MKYEYRIFPMVELDKAMGVEDLIQLQKWFDNGWEYVDSIVQPITTGNSGTRKSCVGIVLRKEKENITL